ncbi:MAG TPA: malectin domain-containing carbohydrate-binding protein [Bryobacteraceae bacterium]|nr:malectin domain-containing carbohydrate-binding protein [Bryobacteraceae bacterium]
MPQFTAVAKESYEGTEIGNHARSEADSVREPAADGTHSLGPVIEVAVEKGFRPKDYEEQPPLARAIPARFLLLAVLLFLAILILVALALLPGKSANAKSGSLALLPPQDSIRVLAGFSQPMYVDGSGHAWTGDNYFTGGTIFSRPDTRIFRTPDSTIYNQGHEGDFRYDMPVKPGVYELRLHFAETRYGQLPLERSRCRTPI